MLEFRKSNDRGKANLGWILSRHTFGDGSASEVLAFDLRTQDFPEIQSLAP